MWIRRERRALCIGTSGNALPLSMQGTNSGDEMKPEELLVSALVTSSVASVVSTAARLPWRIGRQARRAACELNKSLASRRACSKFRQGRFCTYRDRARHPSCICRVLGIASRCLAGVSSAPFINRTAARRRGYFGGLLVRSLIDELGGQTINQAG